MQAIMSERIEEVVDLSRSCCGYCRKPGHCVKNCDDPNIFKIDDFMLQICALSYIFPFVEDKIIWHHLNKLTMRDLKAIKHCFEPLPKSLKGEQVKIKKGLVEALTREYYIISRHGEIIRSECAKIRRIYQMNLQNPDEYPDSAIVTDFADSVHLLLPSRPDYFNEIMRWHITRMNVLFREVADYKKLLRRSREKFNISAVVYNKVEDEDATTKECPICYQEDVEPSCSAEMNCRHTYCTDCMRQYLDSVLKEKEQKLDPDLHPSCGICRTPISEVKFKDTEKAFEIHDNYLNSFIKIVN